jgi:o-succinylbenzoate synthase
MRWRLLSNSTRLQTSLVASGQVHSVRTHLYLEIEDGGLVGYGEASPQPEPLHGDPGLTEVIKEWFEHVEPTLSEILSREGAFPSWFRVSRIASSRPASAVATSILEMALLDLELKQQSKNLAQLWEQRFDTPNQIVVSALGDLAWPAVSSPDRLRVKVGPGPLALDVVARLAKQTARVILDFNCGARSLSEVIGLFEHAGGIEVVAAVEQPFAPGNLAEHTLLNQQLACEVSLDESVRSINDVNLIARHSAASLLCIKPSRVGGYANARSIVAKAHELGLSVYIGGFFESPLARHSNALFARHLTGEPSDIGQVLLADGDAGGWIAEPTGIGLCPSKELLESWVEISSSTIS